MESCISMWLLMFIKVVNLNMVVNYSVGYIWYGKSLIDSKKKMVHNSTSFTGSLLEDKFRIKGDLAFRNPFNKDITKRVPVPYSPAPGVVAYLGSSTNDFAESNSSTSYLATNVYGEYEETIQGNHYIKGMVGFNYEQSVYNRILTRRNGLIFEDINNIKSTNGSGITVSGSHEK